MSDATETTFASRTPLRIGAVGLAVRDLETVAAFYRNVIGLTEIDRDAETMRLGADGAVLIELERRPTAAPDSPATTGLFHTAFLMPNRAELAKWLHHAAKAKVPLDGASDHEVSEAIYLSDPEGNGIEVYSDRHPDTWRRTGGEIAIGTYPLDLQDLMSAADGDWTGAPAGMRVGHIHLRVGDTGEAEAFYGDVLGMDVTARVPGASFLSSGGYHHHIGTNTWRSRGAERRDANSAGLAWFEIEAGSDGELEAVRQRLGPATTGISGGFEAEDPWGTRIRFLRH